MKKEMLLKVPEVDNEGKELILEINKIINVSDVNYKEAKQVRASINNKVKMYENERIKLNKQINKAVKEGIKELTDSANQIDVLIKQHQKELKKEKKEQILTIFKINEEDLDLKWLNETVEFEDIKNQIQQKEMLKEINDVISKSKTLNTLTIENLNDEQLNQVIRFIGDWDVDLRINE